MSRADPFPVPDPTDVTAEEHRRALKVLREQGLDIATRLHAASRAPEADLGAVAGHFARVARAVRQTIHLESRMAEDDQVRRYNAETVRTQGAERRRQNGRRRVGEIMSVARPVFAAAENKTLNEDFAGRVERLNDHDPDFPDRPVGDVIAEICQALGVQNPLASLPAHKSPLPWRERVAPQGSGEGAHRPVNCEPPPAPANTCEPPHPSASPTPSPARGEGSDLMPHPDPRTIVNWGGPTPDTG